MSAPNECAYQVQLSIRLFMPIGTVQTNETNERKKNKKARANKSALKNYGFLCDT